MSDVVVDPFFFELLLQDQPLVGLQEAARAMHGVEFLHGGTGKTQRFDFEVIKQTLAVCFEWAQDHGPEDARSALGVQQLAAVRAWTATPMCYVLTSVLRSPGRTRESVQPVLPFARLLFTALHRLPEQWARTLLVRIFLPLFVSTQCKIFNAIRRPPGTPQPEMTPPTTRTATMWLNKVQLLVFQKRKHRKHFEFQ